MKSISEEKKVFRKEAISARKDLNVEQRENAEREILRKLTDILKARENASLLLYASMADEVPTDAIFKTASDLKRKVYYPKVDGEDIVFYRVSDMAELTAGYRGIREPSESGERYCGKDADNIIIVPGCAFSADLCRLGYGGGYYDRFLRTHQRLFKIGICYPVQLYERIPTENHDIRMDQIVSGLKEWMN